jgi:sortase (surface protein transpeptidase)
VLVAHRDGRGQGRGVFYELGRLDVGDLVSVRTDAGDTVDYSVVARESIAKKRLPYEELFSVEGPPRLTLISCGGYYDPADGGYQDNIVISAVPVADS